MRFNEAHINRNSVIASATALVAVLAFAGARAERQANDDQVPYIAAAALKAAEDRNGCRLEDVSHTTAFAGPALQVVISLQHGERPETHNADFDRFGMDVQFRDEPGNLVSGVLVRSAGPQTDKRFGVLGSNADDGPDSATGTAEFKIVDMPPTVEEYQVYRRDAVAASVSGLLANPALSTIAASADEFCGGFRYDPVLNTISLP